MKQKLICLCLSIALLASAVCGCTLDTKAMLEASNAALKRTIESYLRTTEAVVEYLETAYQSLAQAGLRHAVIEEFAENAGLLSQRLEELDASLQAQSVYTPELSAEVQPQPEPVAEAQSIEEPAPAVPAAVERPEKQEPVTAEEAIAQSSKKIEAAVKNGKVKVTGLLNQASVEFQLPDGFERLESMDGAVIYSDGVGFVEVSSVDDIDLSGADSGEIYSALTQRLSSDARFSDYSEIDAQLEEFDNKKVLVVLFESGQNEDTNINWVQYVMTGSDLFEMVYTLDIDAEEEDFERVGAVFDSVMLL